MAKNIVIITLCIISLVMIYESHSKLDLTQQLLIKTYKEHRAMLKVLSGKVKIEQRNTAEVYFVSGPKLSVLSEAHLDYIKGVDMGTNVVLIESGNLAEMLSGQMDEQLLKYYTEDRLDELKAKAKEAAEADMRSKEEKR